VVKLRCYKENRTSDGAYLPSAEHGFTQIHSHTNPDAPVGTWPIVIPYNDARQLRAINDECANLLKALIPELEARIANLSEKGGNVEQTDFSADQTRNPFLVLNQVRSREVGRPVFTNFARAEANIQTPLEVIPEKNLRFNIRDIERIPEIRARYARTIQTPEGWGSQGDFDTDTEGFNWLPWAVAAGVGLTVASQVL